MERISIVAEAADRVSNKSKGKGLLEGLPQDYWDFVPSENQQLQSNMTKIILSPYQVMYYVRFQPLIFSKGYSVLSSGLDLLVHHFSPEKRLCIVWLLLISLLLTGSNFSIIN